MLKTVLGNTAAQIISRLISSFLAFLITVVLARKLGADLFGEYTKATSYIMLFYLVVDFGINAVFIKTTGGQSKTLRRDFPAFLGLRLIVGLGIAAFSSFGAYALSMFNPGFNTLVLMAVVIASISMFAYALELSALAIFQAKSRYDLALFVDIAGPLAMLGLLLVGLSSIRDPHLMVLFPVAALVINVFVGAFVGFSLVRFFVPITPRFDFNKWKKLLKTSLPLGLVLVLNILYFRIDILILSQFRTSAEIGAYALSYKFFEFAIAIPSFAMNSLYPLVLSLQEAAQLKKLVQSAIVLAFSSLFVAAALFLLAPLITLIKPEYLPAVQFLRLLGLVIPIFYISSPLMWWYILKNKQHLLVPVYAVGIMVNAGLNWHFVPLYGAAASAIITGLTELTVLLLGLSMVRLKTKKLI